MPTPPLRAPRLEDEMLRRFEARESAYTDEQVDLREGLTRRTISHDAATGTVRDSAVIDLTDSGRVALSRIEPIGLVAGSGLRADFEIQAADPLSARGPG